MTCNGDPCTDTDSKEARSSVEAPFDAKMKTIIQPSPSSFTYRGYTVAVYLVPHPFGQTWEAKWAAGSVQSLYDVEIKAVEAIDSEFLSRPCGWGPYEHGVMETG